MKTIITFLSLCLVSLGYGQASPSASEKAVVAGGANASRTDVYLVTFLHAAPGKVAELAESFKSAGPNAPAAGHTVILRHQEGDSWDYVAISHYGAKYTVEAARQQQANAKRDLSDWHNDTIVNGPSWAEFSRALGIGEDAKKDGSAVYIVSTYRTVPARRDDAEKFLAQTPPAGDKTAGSAIMQHLDGAPWQYLAVVRYNSWQDFASTESSSVPHTLDKDSPWSQLRDLMSNHTDTICDRIMP